jgi:hypothetical protein
MYYVQLYSKKPAQERNYVRRKSHARNIFLILLKEYAKKFTGI